MRNEQGFTLPFALVLTLIFSGLVSVAYIFVSINLKQMQSNLWGMQATQISEGINERIKARLNKKNKVKLTPEQEKRLNNFDDEGEDSEEEDATDEFNESTEDFDEYYADEIIKISRYIIFREPDEDKKDQLEEDDKNQDRPEAHVEMIGDITVPEGTILEKKTQIVIFKDEKLPLKLKDIISDPVKDYMAKIPIPKIKSLTPNFSELDKVSQFIVNGENFSKSEPSFNDKDINIRNISRGHSIEFLIGKKCKPGMKNFYWDNVRAEFYVIPKYDGSPRPKIQTIFNPDESEFIKTSQGKRNVILKITGSDLFLKKEKPIAIADACGIIPKVKDYAENGSSLTISVDILNYVEPGIHNINIATEGGVSNSWVFEVLPQEKNLQDDITNASFSSTLTVLDMKVINMVLPLINDNPNVNPEAGTRPESAFKDDNNTDGNTDSADADDNDSQKELTEQEKIGKFGNVDLETVWLLETSTMIGSVTKTVSEIIHRELPIVNSALTTNGKVLFSGGSVQIAGINNITTMLVEPTYLSNTTLYVEGPPDEPEEPIETPYSDSAGGRPDEAMTGPQSPLELGFTPKSYLAVYKDGDKITDLDYGIVSKVGNNTIELNFPGLMDYHYQGDTVTQFVPPIISKEKLSNDDLENHILPKGFSITLPGAAKFKNTFNSELNQFAEVAEVYTTESTIPVDEFDIPIGYMGLTYVDTTPRYDQSNGLTGKGILIIDTRAENGGKPTGDVEFSGDAKSPIDFKGLVYVHGNLRIEGSLNITGGLIVDNESNGEVNFSSNAVGMITYDPQYIRQTILSIPFTTKPGTIMISNKPIEISELPLSTKKLTTTLAEPSPESSRGINSTGVKGNEEDLIDLF